MFTIHLYGTVRDIAGGIKRLDVVFEPGGTMATLLRAVERVNPALGDAVADSSGELTGAVHVVVNGRNIVWLNGLDTVIEAGDEVDFMTPYGGRSHP